MFAFLSFLLCSISLPCNSTNLVTSSSFLTCQLIAQETEQSGTKRFPAGSTFAAGVHCQHKTESNWSHYSWNIISAAFVQVTQAEQQLLCQLTSSEISSAVVLAETYRQVLGIALSGDLDLVARSSHVFNFNHFSQFGSFRLNKFLIRHNSNDQTTQCGDRSRSL